MGVRYSRAMLEAAMLRQQGYEVELTELYLSRVESAVDDWDFADQQDGLLIRITKGKYSVEVISSGDRRLHLNEIDGVTEESDTIGYWKNQLIPRAELALFREFEDGIKFEFGGRTFEFVLGNNGWFEDLYFVDGVQDGDGTDPYYDIPFPLEVSYDLRTRIEEVEADVD